jgi:hypothetical protein
MVLGGAQRRLGSQGATQNQQWEDLISFHKGISSFCSGRKMREVAQR